MDSVEAMIACESRMQEAALAMLADGNLFRWTSPDAWNRFTDTRPAGVPDVITASGATLEIQLEDGRWWPVVYECNCNVRTMEVVGVRTDVGGSQ